MNKPLVNELSKTLGLEMMSIVNVNELREEEEKKNETTIRSFLWFNDEHEATLYFWLQNMND